MNTNIRCKQMFGKQYKKQRSWDLFVYLAKDIAKDLKICLKTNKSKNDINYNGEIISINDWKKILKDMYWSFDQTAHDYPSSPWNIQWEIYWKQYGQYRAFEDWMEERDGHTYYKNDDRFIPPNRDLEKVYYDQVQHGLDLFSKYFVQLVQYDKRFYHYPEKIANDLRAFKMYNIHGIPADFVPNIDNCSSEKVEDETEEGTKKWHEAVGKMYQAFYNISQKKYVEENNDGLMLFAKHYSNLWD